MSSHNGNLTEESDAQNPNNADGSVDDMIENVNQFIRGVYQDLSITPERPVTSTTSTDQDRITNRSDDMVENVNQFIRDVYQDLSISSERPVTSTTPTDNQARLTSSLEEALSTPASQREVDTEDIICCGNIPSPSPLPSTVHKPRGPIASRRRWITNSWETSAADSVIDLSNSQAETPEVRRREAVLVIDLCTPVANQETRRPRYYEQLSRRSLYSPRGSVAADDVSSNISEERRSSGILESSFVPARNTCLTTDKTASNDRSPTLFMCPVCMESCLQRQPTSTVCGHVYCKSCIEGAITHTKKCPMCNRKISNKHLFRIYL